MSDEQTDADSKPNAATLERAREAFRAIDAELSAGGRSRSEGGWSGTMDGFAPVQAEGLVDGLPWYFRARHDGWSFSIAADRAADAVQVRGGHQPGYYHEEDYGTTQEASWMPFAEAWAFIAREIGRFRASGFNYVPDPDSEPPR